MTTEDETKEKWELRTIAHAYQERLPTQYIVNDIFAYPSLNIVYGAPATLKSMLMADCCAAIVAGMDWLPGAKGHEVGIKTNQLPVLWVDMDNGQRRTDERIEAVCRSRNLPETAPFYYVSMPMPPLIMTDEAAPFVLIDAAIEADARMIVIDNLGLVTGEIEENSAGMARIMGLFRQVSERTGAAVVIIHHQRKGGSNGGRTGDSLRGHSSIEAAVDLALQVMRETDSQDIVIRSTKTRGVDVAPMTARFLYNHREGTTDLIKAWFHGVQHTRGENPVRDAIMGAVIDAERITKTRLVQIVYDDLGGETSRSKIRSYLDQMINVSGDLATEKGLKNAEVIVLP